MKKFAAIALAASMVLGLSGCGNDGFPGNERFLPVHRGGRICDHHLLYLRSPFFLY